MSEDEGSTDSEFYNEDGSTDSEYEYYDEDPEEDFIHKCDYRHVNDVQIYSAMKKKKEELWIEVNNLRKVPPSIGVLVHLEQLTISGNYSLYTIPPQIGKLKSLRYLAMNNNSLCELPDEIGDLRKLRELNVSCNMLTTLPSTIGKLTKLETLNVEVNELKSLPSSIRLLKIYLLSIGGNPFHEGKREDTVKLSSLPDHIFD